MASQLIDRYLRDNQCRHGLYLVGWFNCPQWRPRPRPGPPDWCLGEARAFFTDQARALSQGDQDVRGYVMDTALPFPDQPANAG